MLFFAVVAVGWTCWCIFKVLDYFRLQKFSKAQGCGPVPAFPQNERIIGYGLYKTDNKIAEEARILETSVKRFRELGQTFSGTIMGTRFIATTEPENAKALVWDRAAEYERGNIKQFKILLGDSVLTTDGEQWRHSRVLLRPIFTSDRLSKLGALETHVKAFLSRLPTEGTTVDLLPMFHQLTFDTVLDFLFSRHPASESGKEEEIKALARSFDASQTELSRRDRMGLALMFYRNPEFDNVKKHIHDELDDMIRKERIKWLKLKSDKTADGEQIILHSLFESTESIEQIRNEVLTLMLGGRDTLAGLLSNLFFLLAKRPDIWVKLRAEMKDFGLDRIPTYNDLKTLTYVGHVISEGLRYFPPIPTITRSAIKDTTLPRGGGVLGDAPILVPKGTLISLSISSMHKRMDVYGKDADDFRPERWENLRPGWAFLPFSGGPRVCIGQQYAVAEVKYVLARLVQEFESVDSRYPGPWKEGWRVALLSREGTLVGLHKCASVTTEK